MPIFDTINTFEAWQVHSTRRRKAQEALVRARVNLGQRIQENDYRAALFMRREFGLQWRSLMEDHHLDVIAHPTIDALPNFVDPARPGAGPDIRLSVPWSLAGFPVLSVPAGATSGLPVGLSLAGLPGEDAKLWQIGVLMDEYIGLWKSAPEITPPKAFVWPKLSAAQS